MKSFGSPVRPKSCSTLVDFAGSFLRPIAAASLSWFDSSASAHEERASVKGSGFAGAVLANEGVACVSCSVSPVVPAKDSRASSNAPMLLLNNLFGSIDQVLLADLPRLLHAFQRIDPFNLAGADRLFAFP